MYKQTAFNMSNPERIENFVRNHSFGIMTSVHDGRLAACHLPFYFDVEKKRVIAHMARANPQWRDLNGQEVLIVFSGPHAYISPSWYGVPESVPTWNYTAVHIQGRCTVIQESEELERLLESTVAFYEPESELLERTKENFFRKLMKGVVGFWVDIASMEGVEKLSQNKPLHVQQRVVGYLRSSSDAGAHGIAELMETQFRDIQED